MPQIPIIFIADSFEIDESKLPDHLTVDNSIHILSLAIRTRQENIALKIFQNYIHNRQDIIIYQYFHDPEMIHDQHAKEARNTIYEYLAYIPMKTSKIIAEHLEIKYNYCVFKYAIEARNIQLIRWFACRGYPRRISKGNAEVYNIVNMMIKVRVPSELFKVIVENIFATYKNAHISCYTFLNLLEEYEDVAVLFEGRIDPKLFVGDSNDEKINQSKEDPKKYKYLKSIGFYRAGLHQFSDKSENNRKEFNI